MFGFSRGAYTARSTAGLVRNCGILKKALADRIPEAYAMYRSKEKPDSPNAVAFRNADSTTVGIKFVGVWDTVGALGVPIGLFKKFNERRYSFHDTTLSRSILNAYHAVAIDEKRGTFKPTLWKTQSSPTQRVEQAWFAGVHSDIGGGYAENGLSDIAFTWMQEKAANCGLAFNKAYLQDNVRSAYDGKLHRSYKGVYKAGKPYIRSIGKGKNANESVHPDAEKRYNSLSSYKPPNLTAYFNRRKPNA